MCSALLYRAIEVLLIREMHWYQKSTRDTLENKWGKF